MMASYHRPSAVRIFSRSGEKSFARSALERCLVAFSAREVSGQNGGEFFDSHAEIWFILCTFI
ncbi:MAG: hypothetical protein A4E40_00245 [Methanoregulaceae archaeon PtaU1.Bin059]|nr:MAG: hypothetical protein A4E39_00438 [Methanoregulaceae archaeon PtaB.Bin152]OPY43031.1 MAG: hypothetical protein A4E40_00245 [Methanoregulaceae archaeon PtaU1.Bin059]